MRFEQGPIRPPSEAESLLIRLTRNCPWNRCAFCVTYKGKKFSRRSVEEIKRDIDEVRKICEEIQKLSWQWGFGGKINKEVVMRIYFDRDFQLFHVAYWLHHGGKTAFLQDANSMIMKTSDLVEVIRYLKESFPQIERVTTYARSNTITRKSIEELKELREAGLSRVHVGMESGCNEVLEFIDKGITAAQHIEAGRKIKESGLSLSEYVILGLGGRKWVTKHASDTAGVLNNIDPDFIRLRTLTLRKGAPLLERVESGEFEPLSEDEIVKEEREFIGQLEGINSFLVSDHATNVLEEINGRLPKDKPSMVSTIDQYLAMSEEDKINFRLGRRANIYRYLSDMEDPEKYAYVQKAVNDIGDKEPEIVIEYLKSRSL